MDNDGGSYLESAGATDGDPTVEQPTVTADGPRSLRSRLLTWRAVPVVAVLAALALVIALVTDSGSPKRPVGVQQATTLPTTPSPVVTGTSPAAGPTTVPAVKVLVRPAGQSASGTEATLTPGVIVPTASTTATTPSSSTSTLLPAFDAPSDLVAYAAGSDSAQVSWAPPVSSGGAPVTSYRVSTDPVTRTVVVDGMTDQAQLSGLDPTTAYSVTLIATNAEDAVSPAAQTQLVNGASPAQSALWNTFHGDLMRNGQSADLGPSSAKVSWSWTAPPGETIVGDPLVGPDGEVYLALSGTAAAMVEVLSPAGLPVWTWSDPGQTASGLAIGSDGSAFLVADDGIVSIAPGGSQVHWTVPEPSGNCTFIAPLAVSGAGTIYANSTCGLVTEIAAATGTVGSTSFGVGTPAANYSGLAFSADGRTAYEGAASAAVLAWTVGSDAPNEAWTSHGYELPAGTRPSQAPAVGPDGSIYLSLAAPSTGHGYILSLSAAGAGRWTYTTAAPVEATPAVTATGLVVAGDVDGDLYAVDAATGQLAWSHPGGGASDSYESSAAVVAADGTIYVQSLASVQAYSNAGRLLWSAPVASSGMSSPALAAGALYAVTGSSTSQLLAF